MLDVSATDRGLLVPRVALTALNVSAPITAPVASLLVYNTATAGVAPNNVTPGYYYWSGAPTNRWIRFAGDGDAWRTTGNAGTVAATNFLGTTDNIALRIRTNNTERLEVASTGELRAFGNGTAALPIYSWTTNTNMGMFRQNTNVLGFSTSGVERLRIIANGQVVVPGANPGAGDFFTVFGSGTLPYAVNGYAGANGAGVYGQSPAGAGDGVWGIAQAGGINGFPVYGQHLATTGTGVVGSGNNVGAIVLNAGSGGAFTGSAVGSFSTAATIGAYGMASTAANGTGVVGGGNSQVGLTLGGGSGGAFTGTTFGAFAQAVTIANGNGVVGAGNNVALNVLAGGSGGSFFGNTTGAYGRAYTVASGTGVVGAGNNLAATVLATGGGGAFAGTTTGAYGIATTAASGVGVVGTGNNLAANVPGNGAGGAFTGAAQGLYARAMTAGTGMGIMASGNGIVPTTIPDGGGGSFRGTLVGAVGSSTTAANGTGLVGLGNNEGTYYTLTQGSGVAGTGTSFGVYGVAMSAANGAAGAPARAGGYFVSGNGSVAETFTYVAAYEGAGVPRKVMGDGTVNTVVRDLDDNYVLLSPPEAPENLFQDYGTGQLVNGRARIELDPVLSKNILVNDQHPLRVFVQLRGDCKGVYVTNESATGFEVVELMGGTSNAPFFWSVTANRANTTSPSGVPWNYAEERFARTQGPQPMVLKPTIPVEEKTLEHITLESIHVPAIPASEQPTGLKMEVATDRLQQVQERIERTEGPSPERP